MRGEVLRMSDVLPGGVSTGAARPVGDGLAAARAWVGPRGRELIAMGGRATVVAMAVAVITAAAHPVGAGGLPALALVTVIWLVCLRAAAADAPVALGARVPAGGGTPPRPLFGLGGQPPGGAPPPPPPTLVPRGRRGL